MRCRQPAGARGGCQASRPTQRGAPAVVRCPDLGANECTAAYSGPPPEQERHDHPTRRRRLQPVRAAVRRPHHRPPRGGGLVVEEVPVASSPGQFRSLLDGELDVALTSPDNVLAYRFSPTNPLGRLLDAGSSAGSTAACGLALYGRPGVTSPEQLRARGSASTSRPRVRPGDVRADGVPGRPPRRVRAGDPGGDTPAAGRAPGRGLRRHDAQRRQRTDRRAARLQPWPRSRTCARPTSARCSRSPGEAAVAAQALAGPWPRRSTTSGRAGRRRAAAEAATRLEAAPALAARYVDRLRDPPKGWWPAARWMPTALGTVAALRRRTCPNGDDGADVLDRPLDAVRRA